MRGLSISLIVVAIGGACGGTRSGGAVNSSEAAEALIETEAPAPKCLAVPEPKDMDSDAKVAWARNECGADTLSICAKQCGLGNATSCLVMANVYANAPPAKRNDVCLAEIATRGCELQSPASCAVLAAEYAKGTKAVKQDLQRATTLFNSACARGVGAGCAGLAMIWLNKGERIEASLELLEETCVGKRDYGIACYELGRQYESGGFVATDPNKARDLYRRGCETHDKSCDAFQKLGP